VEPDDRPLDTQRVAALLARRDEALARHRSRLARGLGLADVEVQAVLHLARHGELTTARIGGLLELSSGGATALVQRLERLDLVTRRPHPDDRRSSLLRLSAAAADQVARAESTLTHGLETAIAALGEDGRAAVGGFLLRLAELSEALSAPPAHERPSERQPLVRAVPSLWG